MAASAQLHMHMHMPRRFALGSSALLLSHLLNGPQQNAPSPDVCSPTWIWQEDGMRVVQQPVQVRSAAGLAVEAASYAALIGKAVALCCQTAV